MRVYRHAVQGRVLGTTGLCVLLALSGCLAQQSDLIETRVDLDNKIKKLNDKEREIQGQISLANELIKKQKEEVDQLVKETRARLRSEISELRDEALPKMQGVQDEQTKQVRDLEKRSDDQKARFDLILARRGEDTDKRLGLLQKAIDEQTASAAAAQKADREYLYGELLKLGTRLDENGKSVVEVTKRLEARLQEHDRALGAGDARLDQQGRMVTEQLTQFGKALADFKLVLTGLGDKTDALASRTEADAKATTSYLTEVNRSVGSVAKALETMGGTLAARIEQHEQRLGEISGDLTTLGSRVEQQDQRLAGAAAQPSQAPEGRGTKRGTKANKRVGGVEPEQRSSQGPELEAAPAAQVSPSMEGAGESSSAGQAPSVQSVETPAPLVASVPPTDEPPAPAAEVSRDGGKTGAKQVYEASLAKFKKGDLAEAQRGFTDFLLQYPTSELAPNAQYWLGECYYGKRDYRRAIEAFDLVKQVYPRSEKVPAAMLKQSFAYLEVKDRARAASLLKELRESYPKSAEAGRAGAKLAQLEKKR